MSLKPQKPCYLLVGGSPEPSSLALLGGLVSRATKVIAVDRGAGLLRQMAQIPWAFVGDADSLLPHDAAWIERSGARLFLHPVIKDTTDLTLALEVLQEEASKAHTRPSCWVSCVSGGRIDHQLGVVGALARAAALAPVVVEDSYVAWLLSPQGRAELWLGPTSVGRTVSVLSLDPATRVSEQGLFWELNQASLGVLDDLGVSNVVKSSKAHITCHEGACFVVELGSPRLKEL